MATIAFLWDWNPEYSQTITWMDGLAAAIRELATRHEVRVYVPGQPNIIKHPYFDIHVSDKLLEDIADFNPDVILHWGDMTRPNAKPLRQLNKPMAICFAGGEPITYNTYDFDHVFVESQVYKDVFDSRDVDCSIAFGTNTDLFTPLPSQTKTFDTIFPATFAAWKRHSLYAQATQGLRSLAVGYMYHDHEQECWEECLRLGLTVLPHVSAEVLHYLYASARACVITSQSNGGSQRTVLEAMAMNLPLIVTDSDKYDYITKEVFKVEAEPEAIRGTLRALLDGEHEVNTRDYVLENWSHKVYANKLEEQLLKLL